MLKLKNDLIAIFVALICISLLLLLLFGILSDPKEKKEASFGVSFTNPTSTVTSTKAMLPVMVLDTNADRKYAVIQNDSDTAVYLYLGYFANGTAASTTVVKNNGFRLLPAAANEFVIDDTNLYTGQVWATSSPSKKIISIEK